MMAFNSFSTNVENITSSRIQFRKGEESSFVDAKSSSHVISQESEEGPGKEDNVEDKQQCHIGQC